MSEEILCKVVIEVEFKAKEIPSMQEISQAIKMDGNLLKGVTYSIKKIEGNYEWERLDE